MNQKLFEIINQVLINKSVSPIQNISNEMSLRDDLGFSSLDLAEFTVRIEVQFGIDIFEDGIVLTIGDIIKKLDINE